MCPDCDGLGLVETDLAVMDAIRSTCELCEGRRYKAVVLQHTLDGKSISDVLEKTVSEGMDFFEKPDLGRTLEALDAVGVGYLTLGRSLPTLSGDEC